MSESSRRFGRWLGRTLQRLLLADSDEPWLSRCDEFHELSKWVYALEERIKRMEENDRARSGFTSADEGHDAPSSLPPSKVTIH